MDKELVATATVKINAPVSKVWDALTNPGVIKKYMFGTNVNSDWKEGSPITWKGEWRGKVYEDKGRILELILKKRIQYSHFSPLSGLPDIPGNYHTVTIELKDEKENVLISLSQDNNDNEQAKQHSEKNWQMMLTSMKELLEN